MHQTRKGKQWSFGLKERTYRTIKQGAYAFLIRKMSCLGLRRRVACSRTMLLLIWIREMLNAERSASLQQEHEATAGGSTPRNRSPFHAGEEKLSTECQRFESWARAMTSGSFETAWRINDCCGSHWPSAHRLWDEQSLQGASVVVHAKHGLGDAVQMLQYAQRLRDLSASVQFKVPANLGALLPYFQGVETGSTGSPSSSETHRANIIELEMMELPYLFRTRLEDLPLAIDYLAIPEPVLKRSITCMGCTRKPRIGIVWAGGEWDRARWIPLNLLTPLIANDTYEWWNLQGGSAASEGYRLPMKKIFRSSDHGLVALAAIVSRLDLVVTVDTLAAHLAAALGKPTWLMLKHDADWRWLSGRDDSPWYPSLRLFRQPSPGDWGGVITSVERALEEAQHSVTIARSMRQAAAANDHY